MIIIDQPNPSFSPESDWHAFLSEMLKVKYALEDAEEPDKADADEVDRVIAIAKRVIKRFDDEKTAADDNPLLDKGGGPPTAGPNVESKGTAPRFGREFDESEPRDETGKWTTGGGSDGGAAASGSEETVPDVSKAAKA